MAEIGGALVIHTSEYRPCFVGDKKALFHRWNDISYIVEPSISIGGHGGGVVKHTLGMIEYEDGTIEEVAPRKIKFVAGMRQEYNLEGEPKNV